MSDTKQNKAPVWFMIVAAVLLVWNAMGVMAYIQQVTMGPEALAALSGAQRQVLENTPAWATAAFAVAVHGGVLGCLLLLLKKNLGYPIKFPVLPFPLVQLSIWTALHFTNV